MPAQCIYAFGHNIYQKTCPGSKEIAVLDPEDIVPALIACADAAKRGNAGVGLVETSNTDEYDFEVIWSGWSQSVVRDNLAGRHLSLGFDSHDRTSNLHVIPSEYIPREYDKILGFDDLEGFLLKDGRVQAYRPRADRGESLGKVSTNGERYADVAVMSSGEIYAVPLGKTGKDTANLVQYKNFQSFLEKPGTPLRIWTIPLPPLPPFPKSQIRATPSISLVQGHAHLLIHFNPPAFPSLATLLVIGDNRHQACIPLSSTSGKRHTISNPTMVSELEGQEIYAVRAGMGRSAVKMGVGGEAGGEWWIWGKGIDGMERVEISLSGDLSGRMSPMDALAVLDPGAGLSRPERVIDTEDSQSLDDGAEIKDLKLGDGYEMILTMDDRLFVRGRNDFGQLGSRSYQQPGPDFVEHPFFRSQFIGASYAAAATGDGAHLSIADVVSSRWSTFVTCPRAD